MTAYLAIISARFRILLQYRAAALAGAVTQVFWGLIKIMILWAFYRASRTSQPITFEQAVGYTWLGQAFIGMQPWGVDGDVRGQIRSGAIAYELARPVDLFNFWYCRAIGWKLATPLMRCVPIFVFAGLILPLIGSSDFSLRLPPTWGSAAGFALTIFGTLLLSCAITNLYSISMLWTIGGEGIMPLLATGSLLLSGMIIPLPLFPDWLARIFYALPFSGLADTPYRVYTGNYSAGMSVLLFGHQLGWTIALVLLGRWVLARGLKRVVVQGG
jgi:ABC-2 type transport system permease protein